MIPTSMRYPWQRLRADWPSGENGVFVLVAVVLAFFTSLAVSRAGNESGFWAAIIGGTFFPALAVLLVCANPARYRVYGLSMRYWMLDHGILVMIVAIVHVACSAIMQVEDPFGYDNGTPVWPLVVPVVGILAMVSALVWHHRRTVFGRVTGTGSQFTGTPWYFWFFLAKSGPAVWRIIYQPVGLMVTVVTVCAAAFVVNDTGNSVFSVIPLVAPLAAPVVAASREAALAVGIPRRAWLAHVIAAIAGPATAVGTLLVLIWASPGLPGEIVDFAAFADPRPVDSMALYFLRVLALAIAAAALSVVMSLEDWGTALVWYVLFSWGAYALNFGAFQVTDGVWASVGALVLYAAFAALLVNWARRRVVLGYPEWTVTSIIDGARRFRTK
jgi:hypothetical protein